MQRLEQGGDRRFAQSAEKRGRITPHKRVGIILESAHHELATELAERREKARTLAAERARLEEELGALRSEQQLIEPDIRRRREELSKLTGRLASTSTNVQYR